MFQVGTYRRVEYNAVQAEANSICSIFRRFVTLFSAYEKKLFNLALCMWTGPMYRYEG